MMCFSPVAAAQVSPAAAKTTANAKPIKTTAKPVAKTFPTSAKAEYKPDLELFPDGGQIFGMTWNYADQTQPTLFYGAPHTNNMLLKFSCSAKNDGAAKKDGAGEKTVNAIIFATTIDLRPDDQFGLTVRVDNGQSRGLLGKLGSATVGKRDFHMPFVALAADDPLFDALAHGQRVYFKVDGNRFSIDLTGSLQPIEQFTAACRGQGTSAKQ